MKKLILFSLMVIGMMATTFAQQKTLKTVENGTVLLDTVTNVESEYLYGVQTAGVVNKLALQLVATKISGTPNALCTIEFSLDGTNYDPINSNDTFHISNVSGAQTHIWYTTAAPTYHYRIKVEGRGVAAIQIKGWEAIRKDQ
jgi:hypothetical protein